MTRPIPPSSRRTRPAAGKKTPILPRTTNPRLADQTRKVLGKHYASKYKTGRRRAERR
jgi:hypothetical protein